MFCMLCIKNTLSHLAQAHHQLSGQSRNNNFNCWFYPILPLFLTLRQCSESDSASSFELKSFRNSSENRILQKWILQHNLIQVSTKLGSKFKLCVVMTICPLLWECYHLFLIITIFYLLLDRSKHPRLTV